MKIAKEYIKGLKDKITRDYLWKGLVYGGHLTVKEEDKRFELKHQIKKKQLENKGCKGLNLVYQLIKHDKARNKERMRVTGKTLGIVIDSANMDGTRIPKAKSKKTRKSSYKEYRIYKKKNKKLLAQIECESLKLNRFFSTDTSIVVNNDRVLEIIKDYNQDFMEKYGLKLPEESIKKPSKIVTFLMGFSPEEANA
ncbi:hypothetical protein GF352_00155 [archaeon]|nr:hypothetical protein [archaeon]